MAETSDLKISESEQAKMKNNQKMQGKLTDEVSEKSIGTDFKSNDPFLDIYLQGVSFSSK